MLARLHAGSYGAAIAEELGVSRQAVYRHVRALELAGLVEEDLQQTAFYRRSLGGGTRLKAYRLTKRGLDTLQSAYDNGALPSPSPGAGEGVDKGGVARLDLGARVEVHNFEVKVPVERMGIEWLPSAADMNNWTRKWDPDFHGVFLEATPRNILLRAAGEGPTRAMAEAMCLRRVMRVLDLLESHYGCELGRPQFRCVYAPGRTKVGVVGHPLVPKGRYVEGERAVIDSTPEPGTIHPKDANDADRIVHIARNGEETRGLVEAMAEQQTRFYAAVSRLLEGLLGGGRRDPPPPGSSMEVA